MKELGVSHRKGVDTAKTVNKGAGKNVENKQEGWPCVPSERRDPELQTSRWKQTRVLQKSRGRELVLGLRFCFVFNSFYL